MYYIEGLRVLRRVSRSIIATLIVYALIIALVLPTSAQFELRQELRSGDLLVNQETIIVPFQITLFHTQDATCTDTESFGLSPLPTAEGNGFSLSQTSAGTVTAAETGFFSVLQAPYILPFEQIPGIVVGDTPSWVTRMGPIRFAGLPAGTGMIFPDMTMVTRRINMTTPPTGQTGVSNATSDQVNQNRSAIEKIASGNVTPGQTNQSNRPVNQTYDASPATKYDYILDVNNSKPFLPGNVMLVRTVKNARGVNETVIDRFPKKYLQLYATPEEIARRTIMERMWRNVHLNFQMDKAYSGETCYPDLIFPVKDPFALMSYYPTPLTVVDALQVTRPGTHIKKVMWPV